MQEFWDRIQNSDLDGPYVLRTCIDASASGAYFAAEQRRVARVLARVVRGDMTDGEGQLALWNRVAAVMHPNLLPILDTGRVDAGGVPLFYAILEWPEEILGDVLRQRALTPDEARQALLATADALAWLHASGLAHGEVGPWAIVASGDTVKLSSDVVREGGEREAAEDVRALGLTACELLTRRRPEVAHDGPRLRPEERAAVAPFSRFIDECLRSDPAERWNADRLAAHLRNPEPAPVPVPEPPAAPDPVALRPEPEPEPIPPARPAAARPAPAPARAAAPVQPEPRPKAVPEVTPYAPRARAEAPRPRAAGVPKWAYGAGAAAVLVSGFLLLRPSRRAETSAPVPVQVPAAAVQPVERASPFPQPAQRRPTPSVSRDRRPSASFASRAERESVPRAPAVESGPGSWRVIAYTYAGLAAAERKVHDINRKWPQFRAEVFAPTQGRGPYLVALGGRMSRDEALRLQRNARSRGLPRDTYAQNYTR